MRKKYLLFLLALFLLLSTGASISGANWKIGILTGTVTQNEEEFRMAEQLQAEFGPDRIMVATYPDRFMQEQETTISNMLEMATDPACKHCLVQAVPGAAAAVDRVRRLPGHPGYLGSPQEDPFVVASKADIVLNDDLGGATRLPNMPRHGRGGNCPLLLPSAHVH